MVILEFDHIVGFKCGTI